jgi:dTDP-4-amino-4,6-dideoxygalactose transaminase
MRKVKFLDFTYQNSVIKSELMLDFEKFIDSNWYVLGDNVKKFEAKYSEIHGVNSTVGVANGLDALTLSLKAMGIGKGDEIIVPSNTYIATWIAVTNVGATIVPVEPDSKTYNICSKLIKNSITDKTKGILVVHLYGLACEMAKIMDIAEEYGLYVFEDNAQAHLASYKGKLTGSFGIANATSFYPGKNLGAYGDGGAVTVNDNDVAARLRVLRNYGSERKYYNSAIGVNSRLDELQAAFLLRKLDRLEKWNAKRAEIAKLYSIYLSELPEVILPSTPKDSTHVYHQYVIRTSKRDNLMSYLNDSGIDTVIHYPIPPHLQKAYCHLGFDKGSFPIAEELADTSLSLPIYPGLKHEDVKYISETIKNFFR